MLVSRTFESPRTVLLVQFGVVLYFMCVSVTSADMPPVVKSLYGDIRGVRTDKAQAFLGIPFAAPPISQLRWEAPVAPTKWAPSTLNATQRQPGCPQKYCANYMPESSCPTVTSEDCLYMNIWTPLDASPSSSYPVMIFLHGGSFKWGTGSSEIYDGNNMVKSGNIILVTVEYRVGILGFLYTGDGPSDAHGNFGILDQRLGLQWVQQNIQRFGGDPKKVTLFGQSAGAQSTFLHMMSPKSDTLFRAAIVESAPFAVPYRTKTEARSLSNLVFEQLHCKKTDMNCIRGKTVDEINNVQDKLILTSRKVDELIEPLGPVIDGDDVPLQPLVAARLGKFRKMPIILGSVAEEGRLFVYKIFNRTLPVEPYKVTLVLLHPRQARSLEKEYPPSQDPDNRDQLSQVVADYYFTCSIRNATQNLINQGNAHTYLYVFNHAASTNGWWGKDTFCERHVCHGEELAYVFRTGLNATAADTVLSDTMSTYWTNFAHTMDPNKGATVTATRSSAGPDVPVWSTYQSTGQREIMYFKTPKSDTVATYRQRFCDFWDNIGYEL